MALTVTTHAENTNLTTVQAVKDVLGTTSTGDDLLFSAFVQRASDAVREFTGRTLERQAYTETFPAYGENWVTLTHTPIIGTPSILFEGDTIADFTVENPKVGVLYRQRGWFWTAVMDPRAMADVMIPGSEDPTKYSASYVAGFLLPDDDFNGNTFSVTSSDKAFNDSASGFPLLASGDRVTIAGFTNAANNGTFTVTSRTASKVVVTSTAVVAEGTSSGNKTFTVRTLPHTIEQATIEAAKVWYTQRSDDQSVKAKSVGDLSITYDRGSFQRFSLPLVSVSLLQPHVKVL